MSPTIPLPANVTEHGAATIDLPSQFRLISPLPCVGLLWDASGTGVFLTWTAVSDDKRRVRIITKALMPTPLRFNSGRKRKPKKP